MSDHSWDADRVLASLVEERTVMEDINERDTAERIFRENLAISAQAICHLASFSANERTRLQAAQYVVERNLGRLQDAPPLHVEKDPFTKLMEECMNVAS